MARIFLTEEEAHAWGLTPKKWWDTPTKQKVLIRVVSGIMVVMVVTAFGFAGPGIVAILG